MSRFEVTFGHEPIVEDMVDDLAVSIQGMNRKIDRKMSKRRQQYARISVQTSISEDRRHFSAEGLAVPQLFSEEHRQQINDVITTAAREVGKTALFAMEHSLGMRDYFYHRRILRDVDAGGRITPDDWMVDVWAPDYALRFTEATMLGLTKDIQGEQT